MSVVALPDRPLRFGFTLADLEEFTRIAVRSEISRGALDPSDRYEAAWSGVVECLYSAAEDADDSDIPTRFQMINAGRQAVSELRTQTLHAQGLDYQGYSGQRTHRPSFCRYWSGHMSTPHPEASFVPAVVDRIALAQILGRLTLVQREAVLALALHQNYRRAAEALGVSQGVFHSRMTLARDAIERLWHEHETPRKRWADHRVERHTLPPRVLAVFTDADVSVVPADVREVFTRAGADRMHIPELLARLRHGWPARYATWDTRDLAAALRACGVRSRRQLSVAGVCRHGYQLADITMAQEERRDGPDECDAVLADLLEEAMEASAAAAPPASRAELLAWISKAGAEGVTAFEAVGAFPGVNALTVRSWLSVETKRGKLVRLAHGRYAAAALVPSSVTQRPPAPGRADMLALLRAAGPSGLTTPELTRALPAANPGTVRHWLSEATRSGAVIRLARSRYAAATPVPAAVSQAA